MRRGGEHVQGGLSDFSICFQRFLLLAGQIQMAVNGGDVKCVAPFLPPPLSPQSIPSCSPKTAAYFLFNTAPLTCHTTASFLSLQSQKVIIWPKAKHKPVRKSYNNCSKTILPVYCQSIPKKPTNSVLIYDHLDIFLTLTYNIWA